MKVFLSWSKPKSQRFAELLREWLPEVIQEIEPWMSSEDIGKGQRWAAEIGEQLSALNQGILCVTSENVAEPWLNFEAGALAKSLETARVRPLLLDLRPSDVTGPLTLFQATLATDHADMRKFMESLNGACDRPLSADRLIRAFEREWPTFNEKVQALQKLPSARVEATKRTDSEMIVEILERIREMQRASAVEERPQVGPFARELVYRKRQAKMSTNDLSAATRISVQALRELEAGRRTPTVREAETLDKFFAANGALVALAPRLGRGLGRLIPQGLVRPTDDAFGQEVGVGSAES